MLRRILIVEDAETAGATLEIALGHIPDVEVERVRDGREALEYLASENGRRVNAVITDLEMPLVDGWELIRRLREEERFRLLPIVVVSGCQNPETPELVRRLGADAYFGKPWSPLAVRQKVEELLK